MSQESRLSEPSMADGAARFLSENVDITVFTSLLTRAGNELIDDEDY